MRELMEGYIDYMYCNHEYGARRLFVDSVTGHSFYGRECKKCGNVIVEDPMFHVRVYRKLKQELWNEEGEN